MPRYPGFIGEAYPSSSYQERAILENFFLEKNESDGAPTPFGLRPTPGLILRASVSQAPIRGTYAGDGQAYFLAGFAFYELLLDGLTWTPTLRGTVVSDGSPGTIAANGVGDQLGITSGGVFYCYDRTTHALVVAGVPGTVATMGGSLNGRFYYLEARSGTVYSSSLYNGLTWDPSHYLQSTAGDPWITLAVTPDGFIRLFGPLTGEILVDQGNPGFPCVTVQEGRIPFGILAPYAFAVDTSISWVTRSAKGRGQVVRAQGYAPNRISNHGIEHTIQSYGAVDDALAFSYQSEGHPTAVFTFPAAEDGLGRTWAVDEATGKWHGRSFWNVATGVAQAYRPAYAMEAFGATLVGDRVTGSIYELTPASFTDVGGALIRHVRQPAPLTLERRRYVVDSFELSMDVGVGLISGQGSDPQAMLRISRDGGKSFGGPHWTTLGAQGEYRTRVLWNQLGNCRSFVPQLVITDPVPARVTDATITIRPEAA